MEQVSLLEIIELLDGPVRLAPCVEEDATCPRGQGLSDEYGMG